MTQLIIDSGGTKTAWLLLNHQNQDIAQGQLEGMNPYMLGEKGLQHALKKIGAGLPSGLPLREIHFYGAGCRALQMQELLKNLLQQQFPQTIIEVYDDLAATARALLGRKEGIAGILGTGCSTGYYHLGIAKKYAPSNGVWLGDEGSGAYLGKQLIQAYLNHELPSALQQQFEQNFPDRRPDILQKVYRGDSPSAYLGSFVPWLKQHEQTPWVKQLLTQSFEAFFSRLQQHLGTYRQYPLVLSGGIAQHFQNNLRLIAEKRGWGLREVSGEVLEGLRRYHQL